MQSFIDGNVCSHVQLCKLVHVSGVCCHMHGSFISGCAFVYFTIQYCIEYTSTAYFKPRMSGSKNKSSKDVAGTAKKRQLSYHCTFQGSEL